MQRIPPVCRIAPPIALAGAYEGYNRRVTLFQTTCLSRAVSGHASDPLHYRPAA